MFLSVEPFGFINTQTILYIFGILHVFMVSKWHVPHWSCIFLIFFISLPSCKILIEMNI